MKFKHHAKRFLFTATVFGLLLPPGLAAQDGASPTTREIVEERLAGYKSELGLSEYQWSQVHLILKSAIRERVAIARRYGLDEAAERPEPLSGKQLRQLRREVKNNRKNTEDRMERYLTKDQMKVFESYEERLTQNLLERVEAAAG